MYRAQFQKWFATVKDPMVTTSYRDNETGMVNAWKSEFQQALQFAASYIPSTKPGTKDDRRAVADLIKSLQRLLRGAPRGKRAGLLRSAERAAAHMVRERQQKWLKENGRKRVTPSETTKLISEVIKQISFQGIAPAAKIRVDEVRRLLEKK